MRASVKGAVCFGIGFLSALDQAAGDEKNPVDSIIDALRAAEIALGNQAEGEPTANAIEWRDVYWLTRLHEKDICNSVARDAWTEEVDEFALERCKAEIEGLRVRAKRVLSAKPVYASESTLRLGKFDFKKRRFSYLLEPLGPSISHRDAVCVDAIAAENLCLFVKKPTVKATRQQVGALGELVPIADYQRLASTPRTFQSPEMDTATAERLAKADDSQRLKVYFRWSGNVASCAEKWLDVNIWDAQETAMRYKHRYCWGGVESLPADPRWPVPEPSGDGQGEQPE